MTDIKQMSAAEAMARRDIHGSTLNDMAKIEFDPMADRAAYNIAAGGPTSAIPGRRKSVPRLAAAAAGSIKPNSAPACDRTY
jgi:hypothetical protein